MLQRSDSSNSLNFIPVCRENYSFPFFPMKPRRPSSLLFCSAFLALTGSAQAGYLWANYEPETRTYRMEIADLPGKPVTEMSALLLSRIQPYTKSLRKASNGRMRFDAQTLKTAFRARQTEGVVAINGKPTLVVNHVKASAQKDHFAVAGTNGFEICAKLEANQWRVWASYQGEKVEAPIFVDGKEAKAFGGEVLLPLSSKPKGFSLHALYNLSTPGQFGNDTYEAESHRTTLVLAPTTQVSTGSNPESYRALESAAERRESISPTAPDQKFDFTAKAGTRVVTGSVEWKKGTVNVTTGEKQDGIVKEIETQVRSLFEHRREQAFWEGDGRSKITPSGFGSPMQGVRVEDATKARYTLKDGIVYGVERAFGDRTLALVIEEVQWLKNGKYLPKRYSRVELDKSGKRQVELTYEETFTQVGVEHFPASRLVSGTLQGQPFQLEILFTPRSQ